MKFRFRCAAPISPLSVLSIGVGVVVGAVSAADDVTGSGVADDPFLIPLPGD